MSRHALLVYNPKAGSAADADLWLGPVIHKLNSKYIVTVLPTVRNMKPSDIVDAIGKPLDLVIAAGGDGTVRDVMGAIADSKSDVPIGIIPLGTGNQLARNLLIYEENILADPLDEAVSIIMNGVTTRMDLGIMNGQYFCICAGAGPLSDAILMPDHRDKTNWKMLAYASSVIQNFAMPPVMFQIKIDDDENETIQVAASGLFISNIADLGLGTLSETAQLNDGLLDLCILNPSEFGDYLHMGFRFAGGFVGGEAPYYIRKVKTLDIEVIPSRAKLSRFQHIGHRIRSFFSGKTESRPPVVQQVTAMIDGDAHEQTPMRITVVPHAVNVLVPAKFAMQSLRTTSVGTSDTSVGTPITSVGTPNTSGGTPDVSVGTRETSVNPPQTSVVSTPRESEPDVESRGINKDDKVADATETESDGNKTTAEESEAG
ncbi:MAG TPA: diacylglycerol kinase family protein [Drouetiella sp.]